MADKVKLFRIKDKDVQFIRRYVPEFKLDQKLSRSSDNDYVLALTKEEQNNLVNHKLSDLFCSIGLEENDEPNEMGLYIESLIDIFNPYKD